MTVKELNKLSRSKTEIHASNLCRTVLLHFYVYAILPRKDKRIHDVYMYLPACEGIFLWRCSTVQRKMYPSLTQHNLQATPNKNCG